MKIPQLLILATAVLLTSCLATEENNEIVYTPILPDIPTAELFEQLRPKTQKFQVKGNADNSLTGRYGAEVFIPQSCFVDQSGEPVEGPIDIELVEVASKADFVKYNLQTLSNGKPLVSEGMLYLGASANGKPLAVAEGKELQIELPKASYSLTPTGATIFSGSFDEQGNINWTETGQMEDKLIYLPLELFDYKTWTSYGFERPSSGGGYMAPFEDEVVDSTTFKQAHLEKTFVATREFEERFRFINSAEWTVGRHTSFYTTTVKTGQMIKDSAITNIYLNNLDKDLWYCDSLAYAYMKSLSDSIDFNGYHFYETETTDLLKAFEQFYKQKLTNVIKLDYDGVDLNGSNARNQLAQKGLSSIEIDETLGAFKKQQEIVQSRKDQKSTMNMAVNIFKVSALGWVNCDFFFNDPNAAEAKITAALTDLEHDQFVSLSLVFHDSRMALGAYRYGNGVYSFTGAKSPYTRLPIGEKATLVALSYKENVPYMAIEEIEISTEAQYQLKLEQTTVAAINDLLKDLR